MIALLMILLSASTSFANVGIVAQTTPSVQHQAWYYRPYSGGPYGTSDGKSYANAFHLDGSLQSVEITAGDIIYVCGTHDAGVYDRNITLVNSGTVNYPIVIDGNCPDGQGGTDPGTIFAAQYVYTDGWTSGDFGSYNRALAVDTSAQLIEDKTTRLIKEDSVPDATWAAGSFYHDLVNNILYYKPTSGTANEHTIHTIYTSSAIPISNIDYVTVKNLTIANVGTANGAVLVNNADHVVIDNIEAYWNKYFAVGVTGGSDYGRLVNSDIHDTPNGIYLMSSTDANSNDYWTISVNNFHDMDQEKYYNNTDSHAIGIQNGSNIVVSDNIMDKIGGSCVTYYVMSGQTQENNITEDNTCTNVEDFTDTRNQRGIEFGGDNAGYDPDKCAGNIVRNNTVSTVVNACYRTKSSSPTSGYSWTFTGNSGSECGVGLEVHAGMDGLVGFEWTSNTITGSTKQVDFTSLGEDTSGADFHDNTWDVADTFWLDSTAYSYTDFMAAIQ